MLRRWRRLLRRLLSCGSLRRALWLGKGVKKMYSNAFQCSVTVLARQRTLNIKAK